MPTPTHTPTYTLDAGRCLVKDGQPLATLHGVGHYDPCELDTLARTVTAQLNTHAALVAALEATMKALNALDHATGTHAGDTEIRLIEKAQELYALAQERNGHHEEF